MILAADDDFVVVCKPAGLPVIPGRDGGPSLWKQLEAERGERLWVCHRLDQETTGVVVFARTAAAHRALNLAFEHHTVEKLYLAVVVGHPEPLAGEIDAALHPARKGKMRLALPNEVGALPSRTRYETRHAGAIGGVPLALVGLTPRTGRQHQLRVHLRSRGWPILFDALYGSGLQKAAIAVAAPLVERPRQLLHAARLEVTLDGVRRSWEAPWPADLRTIATALGVEPQAQTIER